PRLRHVVHCPAAAAQGFGPHPGRLGQAGESSSGEMSVAVVAGPGLHEVDERVCARVPRLAGIKFGRGPWLLPIPNADLLMGPTEQPARKNRDTGTLGTRWCFTLIARIWKKDRASLTA